MAEQEITVGSENLVSGTNDLGRDDFRRLVEFWGFCGMFAES